MEEYWDLYDADRKALNETHKRGLPLPQGKYHIVVDIWTMNKEGKFILDQRHPDKPFGLRWECTGGSALAGEDSLTGAVRELSEELGLFVAPEHLIPIHTICVKDRFVDTYLNIMDVTLEDLTLQKEEVVDAKFVTYEELVQLWEDDVVSPRERFLLYRDDLKEYSERMVCDGKC